MSAWMPKPLPIQVRRPLMAATRETTVSTLALWRKGEARSKVSMCAHNREKEEERDVQDLAGDDETEDGTLGEGV